VGERARNGRAPIGRKNKPTHTNRSAAPGGTWAIVVSTGLVRAKAVSPLRSATAPWPAVARIDNVFGDRNLVCTCVGMEASKE